MNIQITGASEHNLKNISAQFTDGLTVVTGVSGSGKSSLVFNTLYHESRRRFLDIFATITSGMRMAPAKVKQITGIGPAVAIGQNLLNRNPNSTLATASGLHPFFRLLFARFGEQSCDRCGRKVAILSPDDVVEQILCIAGKTEVKVYALLVHNVKGSHTTLLSLLVTEFGREMLLIDEKQCHNNRLVMEEPHTIELLLDTIQNRPSAGRIREIVNYSASLGSFAVVIRTNGEKKTFNFSQNCSFCGSLIRIPEPKHFHMRCSACKGAGCSACNNTGLPSPAGGVKWKGYDFPGILALEVNEAYNLLNIDQHLYERSRLLNEIIRRLDALKRVGLGYIALNRPSPDLSRGESQRVRIALALVSRLEDMLHILDEPTIGLHPADVLRLMPVLRDLPGSVVFVEHDRIAAAYADYAYDLGPGAGQNGGEVVFSGTPGELWKQKSKSGLYFSLRKSAIIPENRPAMQDFLIIKGAHCHNLKNITVKIPLKRSTVITGVSGSGKSTLVTHVLVTSIENKTPSGCTAIEGPLLTPIHVDQGPIGLNPRSNPATYSGLASVIRDIFAEKTGLSPSFFSFNRPDGACKACNGMGAIEVKMRYLPSEWIICSECRGKRFNTNILEQRIQLKEKKYSIADIYNLEIEQAASLFSDNSEIPVQYSRIMIPILKAFIDTGIGYLTLGQPSPTLSGGEAQRVKLVKHLAKTGSKKNLIILDEPSTGLHPHDVSGLLSIIDRLVRAGTTIVVIEHNTDIIRAADWIIDLGPGAGPDGGHLMYQGPVKEFLLSETSITAGHIRKEKDFLPGKIKKTGMKKKPDYIRIKGANIHNLKNISVSIPKNKLTVVTGVSGSGKSSLVRDILETEAKRRFYESLSMYERQGVKEGADAGVKEVAGLGVSVFPGHERNLYDRRATVGTVTECSYHLAILFSYLGQRVCPTCRTTMDRVHNTKNWHCTDCGTVIKIPGPRYFITNTYGAVCTECHGIGTVNSPAPEKLIIHPEKPLCAGAMYSPGFFPNGYFGKEYNHGHYMLLALAAKYNFDPFTTPWNKMETAAQHAFLYGELEPIEVTFYNKKGFSGKKKMPFPGFYSLVLEWDFGGTFCNILPCKKCKGAKLRPEFLAVTLNGYTIAQVSVIPLSVIKNILENLDKTVLKQPRIRESYETLIKRISFLTSIGLGYISLNRNTLTLSAGEAQRIKLAGISGSGLNNVTILLDEPTRGLHPGEVNALIMILKELRDTQNTLIVVEHDPAVIESADFIVDFGPGSGLLGGRIVARGTYNEIRDKNTITCRWLRGDERITIPLERRKPESWMTIKGASAYNLKIAEVAFPLGILTGICGVSGSGKSTLLLDTIGRALAPLKHTTSVAYEVLAPGQYDEIKGAPSRTITIDQSKAQATSPLSFLGIEQYLVHLYVESRDAHILGIGLKELSRSCSSCNGKGYIVTKMGFMPDITRVCELCKGTGRIKEAWDIKLHGVSLPELYALTINQICTLFKDIPFLFNKLKILIDVGLGYLVLRQPGFSLSGGEVQRLKIAKELGKQNSHHTLYLLDEPSVGQHMEDIRRLMCVLHKLVDAGNTVIICEHHPHLLAACDWLCELGPGGGPEGGKVIASCTPEKMSTLTTPTAPYIKNVLRSSRLCRVPFAEFSGGTVC